MFFFLQVFIAHAERSEIAWLRKLWMKILKRLRDKKNSRLDSGVILWMNFILFYFFVFCNATDMVK